MPIMSSSVLANIRNASYTQTRVQFFPDDEWKFGSSYWSVDDGIIVDGIFFDNGINGIYGDNVGTDAFGHYAMVTTTAVLDNQRNIGIPNTTFDARYHADHSVRAELYFRLVQTTKTRFFIGFSNSGTLPLTSDTPLNTYHGFGVLVPEDGNFKFTSNNGNASSYVSGDLDTIDTDVHHIYLESDYENSRIGYKFDDAAIVYYSDLIPTTTPMYLIWITRTREAVAKSSKIYAGLSGASKVRF